jgi:phage repressor protein C with HTH and peptisase S24 domain
MGKNFDELDYFRAALRYAVEKKGWGSRMELAINAGLSEGYISQIINDKRNPSFDVQRRIAKTFDFSYLDFLVLGKKILVGEPTNVLEERKLDLACACIEDFVLIPKYATRLSGGPGAYVLSENIENTMAFKKVWINQRCNKNGCGLFEVVGDSMAPAICHEDIVLVDMSKSDPKEIIEGKVYAFAEGDKVRIKRLMWKGQELWAVSENKAESPDGAVDVEGFRLIGKVIWVGHEVR